MARLAFALALPAALVLFAPRPATAGAGAMCLHTPECGNPTRFVCVADCDACSVGHCVRLRVLP